MKTMKHYYAKLWPLGYGTRYASTGEYAVEIRAYKSKQQRDEACREYSPPSYCPSARLETALASDGEVVRALRSKDGEIQLIDEYGDVEY